MREWVTGWAGVEMAPIAFWTIIVLAALLALVILWTVFRMFSRPGRVNGMKNRQARLAVMDAAAIDSKRRLVLVRRDDVEHLVMIGGPSDIVIEQNIQRLRAARPVASPLQPQPEPDPVSAAPAPRPPQSPAAAPQHSVPRAEPPRPSESNPGARGAPAAAPLPPLRSPPPAGPVSAAAPRPVQGYQSAQPGSGPRSAPVSGVNRQVPPNTGREGPASAPPQPSVQPPVPSPERPMTGEAGKVPPAVRPEQAASAPGRPARPDQGLASEMDKLLSEINASNKK